MKRLYGMGGNRPDGLKLYNFVDNHDVERIYTKLNNKAQFTPVHILLYTLPGIPSIYYGSEFGIEGRKERTSDASLRPALNLKEYENSYTDNGCTKLISALGKIRQSVKALSYGDYQEKNLTTTQYAFTRNLDGDCVVVTVNNAETECNMTVGCGNAAEYYGAIFGERVKVQNGCINIKLSANSGEIWLPDYMKIDDLKPVPIEQTTMKPETAAKSEAVKEAEPANKSETVQEEKPANKSETVKEAETKKVVVDYSKSYEEMTVEELQEVILQKLASNGPVTDQMRKDVSDNVYHDSLVNWARSFR